MLYKSIIALLVLFHLNVCAFSKPDTYAETAIFIFKCEKAISEICENNKTGFYAFYESSQKKTYVSIKLKNGMINKKLIAEIDIKLLEIRKEYQNNNKTIKYERSSHKGYSYIQYTFINKS